MSWISTYDVYVTNDNIWVDVGYETKLFTYRGDPERELKIALLDDSYTFDASDILWSELSSSEISPTGTYTTGGIDVSSSYNRSTTNLSFSAVTVDTVTAAIKYIICKDSINRLLFAIEYDYNQDFDHSELVVDIPDISIEKQYTTGGAKSNYFIEVELN